LNKKSAQYYLNALTNHKTAVSSVKRKCYLAADNLIEKRNNPDSFQTFMEYTIGEFQKEVREIVNIDKSTWNNLTKQLVADRTIWISLTSFIGGSTGTLPPITLPAAAITFLATVATKGILQIQKKSKIINNSNWKFIYQINKHKVKG